MRKTFFTLKPLSDKFLQAMKQIKYSEMAQIECYYEYFFYTKAIFRGVFYMRRRGKILQEAACSHLRMPGKSVRRGESKTASDTVC